MSELNQDFYKSLKQLAEVDDDDQNEQDKEQDQQEDEYINQQDSQRQDKGISKQQNKFLPGFIRLKSEIIHSEQFIKHLQHIKQPTQELSVTKQLVNRTNSYLTRLELQFSQTLFRSVQNLSHPYFPELQTIITSPRDYLQILTAIEFGRIPHTDLHQIDLSSIVPNDVAFNIKVSLSSSKGRILTNQQSKNLQEAVMQSKAIREHKLALEKYLESQMEILAPNVMAFLEDPNLTARLIASAGGIKELAQSSNIQVMGGYKKNTGAMSTQHAKLHRGIIAQSILVKEASRQNERQMIRMLSTKCALAARVDMFGSKRDGSEGKRLREGIIQRFKKITEAAPPRAKKPRKAPIEKAGTKRAGKRVFSQKKKYQQTQLRKRQNRLKFGTEAQDEYMNTGEGFGMIGKGGVGGGSLKITSQKNQKILRTRINIERSSSDAKSGLESNLNISQMSGISLINPEILNNGNNSNYGGALTQKYFDSKSGFSTVIQDGLQNKK